VVKMHADEVDTDVSLVRRLVAAQFPRWADLPIEPVRSAGRLRAVIDFGCLGVGDPACDVMVAWKVLSADTRDIFRVELSVDEATWARGRGWALSHGLMALSYYTLETNPCARSRGSPMDGGGARRSCTHVSLTPAHVKLAARLRGGACCGVDASRASTRANR